MKNFDASDLISIFKSITQRMSEERDYLCELDGLIGNADHGLAMAQGFAAVESTSGELKPQTTTITDIFNAAAKSFLNAIGASTGPLYTTAFMRADGMVAALPRRHQMCQDVVFTATIRRGRQYYGYNDWCGLGKVCFSGARRIDGR